MDQAGREFHTTTLSVSRKTGNWNKYRWFVELILLSPASIEKIILRILTYYCPETYTEKVTKTQIPKLSFWKIQTSDYQQIVQSFAQIHARIEFSAKGW